MSKDNKIDATYDALRRIPRSQLEERFELLCEGLGHIECLRLHREKALKRKARWGGLAKFIPASNLDREEWLIQSRDISEKMYGNDFAGTGWTVAEYCEECYQDAIRVDKLQTRIRYIKVCMFVAFCTLAGFLGFFTSTMFDSVVLKLALPLVNGWAAGRCYIVAADLLDRKYNTREFI